jgi:hypothetical protein
MYSGGRITVEIMNTRYLLMREVLVNMVEDALFKPYADAHEFYEEDEDGIRTYFYPKMSFNRLTIRDNQEVFDSLFQLYQKGSMPIDVIYELFNLDSDKLHEQLVQDMFTVKDAVYNDMLRNIYNDVASQLVEQTDLPERIIQNMQGPNGQPLKMKKPEGEGEEGGGFGEEESGGGFSDFSTPDEPQGALFEENDADTGEATNETTDADEDDLIGEFARDLADNLEGGTSREDVKNFIKQRLSSRR